MKRLYLIGIGPGSVEYLTLQAVETIKRVSTFFILEKESDKNRELVEFRLEVIRRFRPQADYRLVRAVIPERRRGGRDLETYRENVSEWRNRKAEIIAELINKELKENESGAMLLWGDPSLYDGHIEICNYILENSLAVFEFEVIPGITSLQILAARHRIPLNSIGDEILITTGRRLRDLSPEDVRNAVVLLDNYLTYKGFANSDLQIYWGAYLGTDKEELLSGPLRDVVEDLIKRRNELRKKNGWIMETYILRREN